MTGSNPSHSAPPAPGLASLRPGELLVTVHPDTTESVVGLIGELDLDTAPRLRSAMADVLDDPTVVKVVLDVAQLEFIDSTGLRIVVEAVSRLGERGGELVVRRPRPATLKVLEICGLTQSVRIADD